jgi:hypothetical protein
LTIFKFELNLFVAAIATAPGTATLAWYGVLPPHGLATISVMTIVLGLYLFRAAVASSVLLDDLRTLLIQQATATGELSSGVS